eukprot:FR734958.1.p3 GENE.FR734958.1~~FR734958.1.p3  ORF type:complete len:100 (-),score=35.89 FR734958.1:913-1212(-)
MCFFFLRVFFSPSEFLWEENPYISPPLGGESVLPPFPPNPEPAQGPTGFRLKGGKREKGPPIPKTALFPPAGGPVSFKASGPRPGFPGGENGARERQPN